LQRLDGIKDGGPALNDRAIKLQELRVAFGIGDLVDAFLAAQLGNAGFSPQAFQCDTDLFFSRIPSAGRLANVPDRLLGIVFLLRHHRSSSR
jgi:hypothetical protein